MNRLLLLAGLMSVPLASCTRPSEAPAGGGAKGQALQAAVAERAVPLAVAGEAVLARLRDRHRPVPVSPPSASLVRAMGELFPETLGDVAWAWAGGALTRVTPFSAREQASTPAVTSAPPTATGAFTVAEPTGMALSVRLLGATEASASPAGPYVAYPGAVGGGALVLRVLADGVEDWVELPSKPSRESFTWEVSFTGPVAGLRLVEDQLEWLDAKGVPRLRMSPPVLVGAGRVERHAHVALEGCQADRDPLVPFGRPVTAPGASRCQVTVSWSAPADFYPAVLDPSWTTTGDMTSFGGQGRFSHAAVTIPASAGGTTGVLACGGYSISFAAQRHCEVYNDVAGVWAVTGAFQVGAERGDFAMAYAAPGTPGPRVVAAGGNPTASVGGRVDVFNPATGTWSVGPTFGPARAFHTVTTFPAAQHLILIAGGQDACRTASFVVYSLVTNTIVSAGSLLQERAIHNATALADGTILITGGLRECGACAGTCVGANIGEVVASSASVGVNVGNMVRAGRGYAATFLLPGGQVRIAGGVVDTATSASWADSELYTPGVGFVSLIGFPGGAAGSDGAFGALSNGNLLVAGGHDSAAASKSTNRSYVFNGSSWVADGPLALARRGSRSATTANGRVIATGGADGDGAAVPLVVHRRTEVFDLSPNGTPCSGPGLCQSQRCVDGVCCNSDCGNDCDACNVAGSVGTCVASPSTTVCRVASGACDLEERCTGSTVTCPGDAVAPATAVCRGSTGACDPAEQCNGVSKLCPADVISPSTTQCRGAAGPCDVAEFCDGVAGACPGDAY